MSQAHYRVCTWFIPEFQCHEAVVASLHSGSRFGNPIRPVCLQHLNAWLDECDSDFWAARPEPLAIMWVWDAGTRTCPLHHWPDAVCADWATEHAAMLRAMWPAPEERTLVRHVADPRSLTRG